MAVKLHVVSMKNVDNHLSATLLSSAFFTAFMYAIYHDDVKFVTTKFVTYLNVVYNMQYIEFGRGDTMPIPKDFMKPARLSAKERAFLQLQEWIIDGTLQPLEKLNDAELATALGVSRTPVREALQLLNAQGFVEMHPGVATQVTAVNNADVEKILPVLAALQALAAEEVSRKGVTPAFIQQLRAKNAEFALAIESQNFYLALKLDDELHTLIIQEADNEYIANPVSDFQAHVRRLFFHNSIILTAQSVVEHDKLIEALETHDAKTAHTITKQNWVRASEEYAARTK